MKLHLAIAVVLLLAVLRAAHGDESRYVAGTGDVPLMAGLVENSAAALIYDKPEGRIVDAEASGEVAADDVAAFYRTTLAQLGWEPTGDDLVFVREGERLSIGIREEQGSTVVRFALEPR